MKKRISISILSILLSICLCFGMVGCDWPWDEKGESSPEPSTSTLQYADDEGTWQITVEYGMPYSIEHIPQREGYDFLGLFDSEIGGTKYVAANGSSVSVWSEKRNMVLFPQWQAHKYTLQLNYGNAPDAGIDRVEVSYDGEIQGLPEDFYVEGSEFIGWYNTQDASGTKFVNGAVMDKSLAALADENNRIALHAIFDTAKYTVRFYSFDGNSLIEEKQVMHGADIAECAPKTLPDGSEILGWSTSKNGYGNEFTGEITDSGIFYVKYYNCTLTLDPGNGSSQDIVKVKNGQTYTLEQLSRTGYDFLGWDDGSGNLRTGSITPTANMTLTAKWRAIFYTVRFSVSAGEGTVSQGSKSVTFGGSFSFPVPTSSRNDYEFDGWYSDTGKKLTDKGGNSLTEWNIPNDTTVTARFVRIEYTITFSTGGGTSIGAKTVYKGDSIDLPESSREGYTFNYWKTSSGAKVTSPYKPTGNITLYAHWTANTYTVSFNLDGGSMSTTTKQVIYGSSFSLPVPTKTGYSFDGWYYNSMRITDSKGTGVSGWNIASSVTVTAKWNLLPAEVYNGTIRDKDFKINRDNETHDKFSLNMDLATLKAKGFTKLKVTVQFAIKENDDCGQHFRLYDEKENTIYEDVIYHGGNKKDSSWGWHSFECEISLSAIQSTTWTLHFWGDNQVFHDYWQGTTTAVVTAIP